MDTAAASSPPPPTPPPPPRPSARRNGEIEIDDVDTVEISSRRPELHTIYAGDPAYNEHRVALIKQLDITQTELTEKQNRSSSSRLELYYQVLGLFFVFQGVILTAVSQSNLLRCHNWYLPFLLSFLASVTALMAAVQKLREIKYLSEQQVQMRAVYYALFKSVDSVKERGTDLDIGEQPLTYGNGARHNFFSVWVFSFAGAVLLIILLFSGFTLFAVHQILCHPGEP